MKKNQNSDVMTDWLLSRVLFLTEIEFSFADKMQLTGGRPPESMLDAHPGRKLELDGNTLNAVHRDNVTRIPICTVFFDLNEAVGEGGARVQESPVCPCKISVEYRVDTEILRLDMVEDPTFWCEISTV